MPGDSHQDIGGDAVEQSVGHVLRVSPLAEAAILHAALQHECREGDQFLSPRTVSFGGDEYAELIMVLTSASAVRAIARVLVAWIKSKRDRVVVLDGQSIRGYSADDVVRIMSSRTP
ncbi:MAG: hypothetical protein M3Q23_15560 [Actinomycetota bacterium]|nr:hypothetical protein [Actinomycetota bacterium]